MGKEGNVEGVQQLARELHKLMCIQYLLGPIVELVYDKRNNNRYEAVSTAGIATSSIDLKREIEREAERVSESARNDFVGGRRWSEWLEWQEQSLARQTVPVVDKSGKKTTAQTGNGEHLEQWAN